MKSNTIKWHRWDKFAPIKVQNSDQTRQAKLINTQNQTPIQFN